MQTILKKRIAFVIVALAAGLAAFFRFLTLTSRMTHCDDTGFLVQGFAAEGAISAGDSIASYWTYAPAQFVLGYPIWSMPNSWPDAIWAARLPSAIAGTFLGLVIVWLLSRLSAASQISPFAGLFSMVLAFCGLRAMVESQQGYPYAVTCLLVALTATILYAVSQGRELLEPRRLPLLIGSLAAWGALSICFSFQLTISVLASCLALLICAFPELRKPGALRKISGTSWLAGGMLSLFGAAVFYKIWVLYLGLRINNNQGLPPWSAFDVVKWHGSPVDFIQQVLSKWVDLAGYSVTPLWPPIAGTSLTRALGVVLLALLLSGLPSLSARRPLWQRLIAWYSVLLLVTSFALNLAGKMPFGVTRHSHFLLPALLLLSGFGEANILAWIDSRQRKSSAFADWLAPIASILLIAVFYYSFPQFHQVSRNQFDMPRLVQLVHEKKPLKVVCIGCTFDPMSAQWATRGQMFPLGVVEVGPADDQLEQALKMLEKKPAPASIFVVDHRSDPESTLRATKHPSLTSSLLVGVNPIGSTEMMGMVNGGNGFFIRQITKSDAVPDLPGCKASLLKGWHSREANANGWWRWSEGVPTLMVVTTQDANLTWKGEFLSIKWPQKLDILVNGKLVSTWDAKQAIDISFPLRSGENLIQLKAQTPGVQSGLDPRVLSFGLKNLTLSLGNKVEAACDLEW